MFIDEIVIEVSAGRGGHGMTSFRREKYVEFGGPSGGNGGKGASIFFVGDEGKTTLLNFRYMRHIKGKNGENGKSKGMHGAAADNFYVKVPLGTIVYNLKSGLKIGEIIQHNQQLLIAKGGNGGRGNMAFATHKNPAPRISENGDMGDNFKIKLDLKVLADVGLLGFPSVGKSTIITNVSNSKAKVADYPFTTLSPNLGMVRYKQEEFVLADLPGIIENASHGEGLGIKFLKHIERCRLFLHVIDVSSEDPFENFKKINKELESYDKKLLDRRQIVVLNKIDLVHENKTNEILMKFKNYETILISAYQKKGMDNLLDSIIKNLKHLKNVNVEEKKDDHIIYQLEEKNDYIDVVKKAGIFYVTGNQIHIHKY